MSDIVKKNGNELTQWDPFRMMREMLRWDPFREMAPTFATVDRGSFNPTFDVTETKDAFRFKADVPGVKPEEIEISTTGNRLQISGKRDHEHENTTDQVYTYERQYGSFVRTFTLPAGVDAEHAKSELKDGVLTLVIPKKAEAQPKKISITAGTSKS